MMMIIINIINITDDADDDDDDDVWHDTASASHSGLGTRFPPTQLLSSSSLPILIFANYYHFYYCYSLPLNSSPPLPILTFANYSSSSLSRGILFLRFFYMGTQQYD